MAMGRRAAAVAIVLLIAGLAPASAIIGYCARMPCCHHTQQPLKISTDTGDCCTTVACYETPSAKLSAHTALPAFVAAPVLAPALIVFRDAHLPPALTASPPATTQQRLAILSVLLI